MIVRLFAGVLALNGAARLARREFLKARSGYAVELGVLSPMGDDLVGVGTDEIALETVKVRGLVLHRAEARRVRALSSSARHVRAVLLKISAHQSVQALVSRRVLNETGLVAKRVSAVLSHAVEMRLMLAIAAVRVATVLVEAKSNVALGHGFVLQHPHRMMKPLLLGLRRIGVGRRQGPLVEIQIRREGGERVVVSSGRHEIPRWKPRREHQARSSCVHAAVLQKRWQSLVHQSYLLVHSGHDSRTGEVKTVTEIKLEARRHARRGLHVLLLLLLLLQLLLRSRLMTDRLNEMSVLAGLDRRDVASGLVGPAALARFSLDAALPAAVVRLLITRSWTLELDLLQGRLLLIHLAEGLLHLALHVLEALYALGHLGVLGHELVFLGELRQVVLLKLLLVLMLMLRSRERDRRRDRDRQVELLLGQYRSSRVLRYVGDQSVELGEGLITGVAVVVVLSLELAERSAAALVRAVERVSRTRARRRQRLGLWKIKRRLLENITVGHENTYTFIFIFSAFFQRKEAHKIDRKKKME